KSDWIRNIAIFGMILAHREEALILFVVHIIVSKGNWKEWLKCAPGVILGLAVFAWYYYVLGPVVSRANFIQQNLRTIEQNLHNAPLILFLTFNWFWLVIGWNLYHRRHFYRTLIALAVVLAATFLTLDTTRVAVVCGLPLILFLINTPELRVRRPWPAA